MNPRRAVVAASASIVVLAACARESRNTARSASAAGVAGTVTDSTGVAIVSFDSTASGEARVLRGPAITIGATPESELAFVSGAIRRRDGAIVVADGQRLQLLLFDSVGTLRRVLGRDGSGPGEFRSIMWMGRLGRDSIAVFDMRQLRMSVFADTGFARSYAVRRNDQILAAAMTPAGFFPGGRPVIHSGGSFLLADPGPARIERNQWSAAVYDAAGNPGALIGRFPGNEVAVSPITSGPIAGRFSRSGLLFGRSGALAVAGDRLVALDNGEFRIDEYDDTGRLRRSIRRAQTPEAVTDADVEALIEERAATMARPEAQARMREAYKGGPRAQTFPILEPTLVVDADDHIWVGEYRRPGMRDRRWWVFSLDGVLLREVMVPGALQVTDADSSHLVGVWRDQDGVQTVRVYDLVPRDSTTR